VHDRSEPASKLRQGSPQVAEQEAQARRVREFGVSPARFVTGNQDIDDDAQWQAYVHELEQMGVERYVEIYHTAYDGFGAGKEE
jgi:hypothetical protein